jgi:beta-glucosidase
MKKNIFCTIAVILFLQTLNAQTQKKEVFRDENFSIHERISDLLSKMTMEEKVSLLRATSSEITRLEIDKYYHGNEALHGVVRPGNFTVFPQAIGLAAMWNPDLHYQIATAISDEARARWNELEQGKKQMAQFSDLLTFWSPTVNMARDPRWGRTPETYGEDPFLSGILGTQFVKGLQGNDSKYLKIVSTPKHFAVNNEEHNRFECNPQVTERILREYYFPAFEQCVREGKAASIMTAYNDDYDITKGRTYQYFTGKPLYAFGYGLSYSSFEYKNMSVQEAGEVIKISFNVKNVGKKDGDEVTQLYVKLPKKQDISLPIKQLKGFERIFIKKGQTEKIEISIFK